MYNSFSYKRQKKDGKWFYINSLVGLCSYITCRNCKALQIYKFVLKGWVINFWKPFLPMKMLSVERNYGPVLPKQSVSSAWIASTFRSLPGVSLGKRCVIELLSEQQRQTKLQKVQTQNPYLTLLSEIVE